MFFKYFKKILIFLIKFRILHNLVFTHIIIVKRFILDWTNTRVRSIHERILVGLLLNKHHLLVLDHLLIILDHYCLLINFFL